MSGKSGKLLFQVLSDLFEGGPPLGVEAEAAPHQRLRAWQSGAAHSWLGHAGCCCQSCLDFSTVTSGLIAIVVAIVVGMNASGT